MELVTDLGTRKVNKKWIRFGIYKCPICKNNVEVQVRNGNRAKTCFNCINRTHGETNTRLFRIWTSMKTRVKMTDGTYAELSIDICDEWNNSFESFRDWSLLNGYKDNLSIDRIENNKGYSADNCRWATATIQQNNKREIQRNNKTGHKGISVQGKKYRAGKTINKKSVCFGLFDTLEEAVECYKMNTK